MNTDKFFKRIWNINSVIILLGSLCILASLASSLARDLFRDKIMPEQTLDLAADTQNDEKWSLGYPEKIQGSKYYLIPLESEKKQVEADSEVMRFASYEPNSNRAKNILFIDNISNESTWLFESVKQLIINKVILTFKNSDKNISTKAIYYEVINNDTNNDGVYDLKDKRSFSLSKVDGTGYREIISGYNSIVEASINDNENLFVIYIINEKVHSMVINLNNFEVIHKNQLQRVSDS